MINGRFMKIDMQSLSTCFSRDGNVVAAWVFGSAKNGNVRPDGDIDIGVLFGRKPLLDELAELRSCLQDVLSYDDIDLVTLNDASPILRFEAVSGRPVYVTDAGTRAGFVSLTAREYEDEMAQWRMALTRMQIKDN
jgi:predicted nucleotidyltransferase